MRSNSSRGVPGAKVTCVSSNELELRSRIRGPSPLLNGLPHAVTTLTRLAATRAHKERVCIHRLTHAHFAQSRLHGPQAAVRPPSPRPRSPRCPPADL